MEFIQILLDSQCSHTHTTAYTYMYIYREKMNTKGHVDLTLECTE